MLTFTQKTMATGQATAPASERRIYPRVKVWLNSFIPHERIGGPPGYECFAGDDRGFSNDTNAPSRTHQEIEVQPDGTPTINWKRMGRTHELDCESGVVIRSGTASTGELRNGPIRGGRTSAELLISFGGAASNPLVPPSPAIDFEALFRLNLLTRQCGLDIVHDSFPAYEAYVAADGGPGIQVYAYDPIAAGEGLLDLYPPMDKTGFVPGISF